MFLLQSTHLLWVFYSQSTSNVKFWNFSPLIYYVRSTCNFYPSIFYGFLTSIAGIVKMAANGNAPTMFMLSLIWFLSSVKKSTLRKLEAFAKKNSFRVQPAHLSFIYLLGSWSEVCLYIGTIAFKTLYLTFKMFVIQSSYQKNTKWGIWK